MNIGPTSFLWVEFSTKPIGRTFVVGRLVSATLTDPRKSAQRRSAVLKQAEDLELLFLHEVAGSE